MKNFIKSFFISLVIFLGIGACFSFLYIYDGMSMVRAISQGEDLSQGGDKEFTTVDGKEITFAMLGVDTLEAGKYNGIRTDTIMIVKCDFEAGSLKILSIPRDTRVAIKGKLDKINHAHSYGGVDLALDTINNFLGTDIKNYVRIDYRAVKEVVDAIGGVDLYVPRRMEYYDPTVNFRVDLYEGQQVLDGDKAMQFLRWRKNNALTAGYRDGDVGRIETQQYFIKEFVKQVLKPKNLPRLPKIIDTYFQRVDTNISLKEILNGMMVAKNLEAEDIRTEIVPGDGKYIDNVSYYVYDQDALEELIEDMELR